MKAVKSTQEFSILKGLIICLSFILVSACSGSSQTSIKDTKASKKANGASPISDLKDTLKVELKSASGLPKEGSILECSISPAESIPKLGNYKLTFSFYNSKEATTPRYEDTVTENTFSASYKLKLANEVATTVEADSSGDQMKCVVTFALGSQKESIESAPLTVEAQLGADSATPTPLSATQICSGTTVDGISGTATCATVAGGTTAEASHVVASARFWDSLGQSLQGTMANKGTWSLTGLLSAFPGAGYYTAVENLPGTTSICSTTTVVGVLGTAVCQSGTATGSDPAADQVLSGRSAYKSDGSVVNGSMSLHGNWNINTTVFPGAGYYTGVTNNIAASDLCSGKTLLNTAGTAPCAGASGGTGASASEVLSGKYFWTSSGTSVAGTMPDRGAWDLTTAFPGAGFISGKSNTPSASSLCVGTSVDGVAGTAVCGSTTTSVTATTLYRNSGGTPTQLTYQGAAGTTLPSGYRDIPDSSKDDDSTASGTAVSRNGAEWNTGVARKVCGMGIETIAGRIADCDTRHSTKPSWDAASSDSRISWDGSVKGIAGESSWTLVTVYDPAQSNGDTCGASSCREVWRDDRTGYLWSDLLGDQSTNANQGKFNWCLAAGNVENAGSRNCAIASSTSYNKVGVSLCAEASGLTTPVGIHDDTTANDLTSWNSTGTSIRDAKGGMLATANSDPEGAAKSPSVYWRLPTRNDYYQAEIDGIRFVLKTTSAAFWSATISVASRGSAFYYRDTDGHSNSLTRTNVANVRCVGMSP